MNRGSASRIEILNYVLGGVASLAAIFVCSQPQVIGLLLGALLGALNFTAVKRIVAIQIDAQKSGEPARQTLLVIPKMLVLAAAMAACVFFLPSSVLSVPFLALGFSIFMISIAIETVRFLTNPSSGKDSGSETNG